MAYYCTPSNSRYIHLAQRVLKYGLSRSSIIRKCLGALHEALLDLSRLPHPLPLRYAPAGPTPTTAAQRKRIRNSHEFKRSLHLRLREHKDGRDPKRRTIFGLSGQNRTLLPVSQAYLIAINNGGQRQHVVINMNLGLHACLEEAPAPRASLLWKQPRPR